MPVRQGRQTARPDQSEHFLSEYPTVCVAGLFHCLERILVLWTLARSDQARPVLSPRPVLCSDPGPKPCLPPERRRNPAERSPQKPLPAARMPGLCLAPPCPAVHRVPHPLAPSSSRLVASQPLLAIRTDRFAAARARQPSDCPPLEHVRRVASLLV